MARTKAWGRHPQACRQMTFHGSISPACGHSCWLARSKGHRKRTDEIIGNMVVHPVTHERVGWVDTAKGAAILLVVLSHAGQIAHLIGDFPSRLDAVHHVFVNVRMPLFFLASGLLMSRLVERPWDELFRKRVIPMAWVLILWTLIGSSVNQVVPLYPRVDMPVTGVPITGILQVFWLPQGALWFVYALIVFAILARTATSFSGWQRIAIAVALWLALALFVAWHPSFHTRNMVEYMPFYMGGVLSGPWILRATSSTRGLATTAAACLAGIAAGWMGGVGGLPGKAAADVFGTGLFVVVAAVVQPWDAVTRVLNVAGRNSLAIFLGHIPVLALTYAVLPLERLDPIVAWLALFALAVAGALTLELAVRRLRLGWLYVVPEPIVARLGSWMAGKPSLSRS